MPIVVGLGNEGAEYTNTPHNVGFEVAERLVRRVGATFRRSRIANAEEALLPGDPRVIVLRPLSYMNRSGEPVGAALRWYRMDVTQLLVICDDVNLPLGYLRLRSSGGAGGQKGLISIIEAVGTDDFVRLRIGVGGGSPGADVARHVLAKFPADVRATVDRVLDQATDAVECFLREGLEAASTRYNTPRKRDRDNFPSDDDGSSDNTRPEGDD